MLDNKEVKKFINSTILNRATYDKSSKKLTTYEKRGIVNEYYNIPENVKDAFFKNGKPGKYYHVYIKGQYKSKDMALVG